MDMKKTAGKPAKQDATATQDEKRKPVDYAREGDVSGSIWARDVQVKGAMRRFHSCTFERSYKDKDGTYRYTKTFDRDSLGKLVTVAQQLSEKMETLERTVQA